MRKSSETEELYKLIYKIMKLEYIVYGRSRVENTLESNNIDRDNIKDVHQLKMDKYDKVTSFLMYDMDVIEVNQRFNQCKATLLLSNPCIEFWFLLHETDCSMPLSSDAVIRELRNSDAIWKHYTKGTLTFPQQSFLWHNRDKAIVRAKALKPYAHPSSSLYLLLEQLDNTLNKK